MKAVRIHEFGGPDVIRLDETPLPEPKRGEVLIRIFASSVNPIDYKIRSGGFVGKEQLPLTLGRDIAGVIQRRGANGVGFHQGDAVFAMLPGKLGGQAEFVTVAAETCAKKPENLSFVEAAAVPLAGLTAWQGLFDHGKLREGQSVLIHGASGGVGHLAVQFAQARGAGVIATCRGEDRDFVKHLGAMTVVDYQTEDFRDAVRKVDLVFDLVGGETQAKSWQVLKDDGLLVSTVSEPETPGERGLKGAVFMAEPNGNQLREIAHLIETGQVRPTVEKTFPLADVAGAERHLEQDHVRGKVVVEVSPAP